MIDKSLVENLYGSLAKSLVEMYEKGMKESEFGSKFYNKNSRSCCEFVVKNLMQFYKLGGSHELNVMKECKFSNKL